MINLLKSKSKKEIAELREKYPEKALLYDIKKELNKSLDGYILEELNGYNLRLIAAKLKKELKDKIEVQINFNENTLNILYAPEKSINYLTLNTTITPS